MSDPAADPWALFERLRWDGPPPACVHCAVAGRCTPLPREAGVRRVWRCAACRTQFSVLSGTLFERTRLPLPTWRSLLADASRNPDVTARGLARAYAITPETARGVLGVLSELRQLGGVADRPDAALRAMLRLPADEARRLGTARRRARLPAEGPSADYR